MSRAGPSAGPVGRSAYCVSDHGLDAIADAAVGDGR